MWEDTLINVGGPSLVGIAGILGTFFAPARVARQLERRSEQRAFRRARRLVLDELDTISMQLELVERHGTTPSYPAITTPGFLSTDQWEAHKHVLAEALTDRDWEPLPIVVHRLARHRDVILSKPSKTVLTAAEIADVKTSADLISGARTALFEATPVSD